MEQKRNRSDAYQALFHEIAFSQEMLGIFSNNDSISSRLCPYQYDERLLDLQDQLKTEFWRVVRQTLTDKQRQIVEMTGKEGLTQQETAKRLQINQSSCAKSLHGNSTYEDTKSKSSYGGSYKKLQVAVSLDPKIQDILTKISELREERW